MEFWATDITYYICKIMALQKMIDIWADIY